MLLPLHHHHHHHPMIATYATIFSIAHLNKVRLGQSFSKVEQILDIDQYFLPQIF
jgi:hypothetical protein